MRAEMAEQPEALRRARGSLRRGRGHRARRAPGPARRRGVPRARLVGQRRRLRPLPGRARVGPPGGARRAEPAHAVRRAAPATTAFWSSRSASRARRPRSSRCAGGCGEAGARTVAVVNDADSPLGGAADAVLALGVGPERAVPATKTVTGQMLADGRRGRGHRAGAVRRQASSTPCPMRCAPCSTTPSRPPARGAMGATGAAVRGGARAAVRGGTRGRAQDQGDHGHPGGGDLGRRPPPRADRGGGRRRAGARARRRRRRP